MSIKLEKAPSEFIDLLNKGVTRELQVSVQYILQHTKMEKLLRKVIKENYLLDTTTYDQVGEVLKEFAVAEMKYLGAIMERIYILGSEATTKPDKITVGNSLKEFATLGVKAEEEALELYRTIIEEA
jgi:bacterioferritin